VTGRPHRHSRCLEGTDWVAFNDLLNDVLDRLGLDADAWSYNREAHGGRYYIRRGRRRRVRYDEAWAAGVFGAFRRWAKAGPDDFEDHCGREAPRSELPEGTPGLAGAAPDEEHPHEAHAHA
jgi:hypothetical protein